MKFFRRTKNATCPYCEKELETKPQRKKKCPHCGNFIIVRTPYLNKKKKEKILLTKSQAKDFDKEKRRYYDRKNWIRRLSSYDMTDKEFDEETENLKKRFGFNPPYADVAWGLLNKRKLQYFEALEFGQVGLVCHDMARICYQENKPFQHFLEESHKYGLMAMEWVDEQAILHVDNRNDEYVCQNCRTLEGKKLTYK